MYDVAGEKRPIFVESDALLYNLGDPNYSHATSYIFIKSPATSYIKICRANFNVCDGRR